MPPKKRTRATRKKSEDQEETKSKKVVSESPERMYSPSLRVSGLFTNSSGQLQRNELEAPKSLLIPRQMKRKILRYQLKSWKKATMNRLHHLDENLPENQHCY